MSFHRSCCNSCHPGQKFYTINSLEDSTSKSRVAFTPLDLEMFLHVMFTCGIPRKTNTHPHVRPPARPHARTQPPTHSRLRSAPPHTGSEKSPERTPGQGPKVRKECAPESQMSPKRVRNPGDPVGGGADRQPTHPRMHAYTALNPLTASNSQRSSACSSH